MKHLKIKILIGIICTLSVLYFFYAKYFSHFNNRDLVLSEDSEEYKRKPIDPGGIVIPNSNSLIYEKLNLSSAVESKVNLLPAPEEPMELMFKTNAENIEAYDSIDDILAKIDLDSEDKNTDELPSEKSAEVMPNSLDKEFTEELGQDKNSNQVEELSDTVNKLKITKLAEETNKLANLNSNSVDTGYKIQLSSAWSEKEARDEWLKLQSRYIKYLKNAQLVIKKVKANNDRIIYLVMAGNYSSLGQAKLICKKLTLSKQNCIVTK